MGYCFTKTLQGCPFEDAVARAEAALKAQGFGVLCRIDVQATLKEKLGEDMPPYLILGACNPQFAHKALQAEPNIGVMLPCNVTLRTVEGGVEVAAVDPAASMQAVDNPDLEEIAGAVRDRMPKMIDDL